MVIQNKWFIVGKNNMNKIGVMQGRLTPSRNRGVQFFPFGEWQKEFTVAAKLGLDNIDFIFDLENFEKNPLWTVAGRSEIKSLIKKTGVVVRYITADFFMRQPFFRNKIGQKENIAVLLKLIRIAKEIGVKAIEIPILDNSSIKTDSEEKKFRASITQCLNQAKISKMTLALESDFPPVKFLKLLNSFKSPLVKAIYDTGNSVALNYQPNEELPLIGKFISHVHIKDRKIAGSTVALGTGAANFPNIFSYLKKIGFAGNFIIQAARGKEGQEEKTVRQQRNFVNHLIKNYLG